MKELFIPYTEALELKELGFNEKCLAAYTNRGKFHQTSSDYWDNDSIKMIKEYTTIKLKVLAPLYTQAFKWFRDTHNLDAWVEEINHGINNDKKQYITLIFHTNTIKKRGLPPSFSYLLCFI